MGIKSTLAKWLAPELRTEVVGPYSPEAAGWYSLLFPNTDDDTGVIVTDETALQTSAVFACVNLLSRTVARLPIILYKRDGDSKERDYNNPLYYTLHDQPNDYQTDYEFKEYLMRKVLMTGNFYAEKIASGTNAVEQLIPLDSNRVEPYWVNRYKKAYRYTPPNGQQRIILASEMLHVMTNPDNEGLKGLGLIDVMFRPIGATIAAEKYGARFYKNNAIPSGILEHPNKLSPEGEQNLKESWSRNYEGVINRGKVILLQEGMKYNQMAVTPEAAQFLETRKFNVNDIARVFGVPPHLIGDLEKATFSNIEEQNINFVTYSLTHWTANIEKAIKRDLFTRTEKYTHFVEFLYEDLLKGQIDTRYEAYVKAINNGIMSTNEIRRKENLNPVEGGDQMFRSTNTLPLNEPFEQPNENIDNKDDPIDMRSLLKGNGVIDEKRN